MYNAQLSFVAEAAKQETMRKSDTHYSALDAMRGIAALTVVFSHLISYLRGSPYDKWIPKYVDNSVFNGMSWGISPAMFFSC